MTDITKPGAFPEDHPRARFDMYPARTELPDGWGYEVDDYGVTYAPGLYPFSRSVRLAPDVTYQAWGGQYVLVGRRFLGYDDARNAIESETEAEATTNLTVRSQGMGAITVGVTLYLDLTTERVSVRYDDLTEEMREQAQHQGRRILDLFRQERARRDSTWQYDRPITAHDRYNARDAHDAWELVPGNRYDRLVTRRDRSAVAFIDHATGTVYEARSWSKRGRLMAAENVARYAAVLQRLATTPGENDDTGVLPPTP